MVNFLPRAERRAHELGFKQITCAECGVVKVARQSFYKVREENVCEYCAERIALVACGGTLSAPSRANVPWTPGIKDDGIFTLYCTNVRKTTYLDV